MHIPEDEAERRRLNERGREILRRKNGAVRPHREDGYVNLLNKYGTKQDNSEAYKFEREPVIPDMQLTGLYEGNGLFCYSFCIAAGQNGHRDSVSAGSSNIDAVCTNSIADQQLQRILACMQCICAPTFIGCDDKIVAIAALSDFSLIRTVFEGFIPYRFNAQCFEPGNGRIVILPHITDSNFACITHW